MTIAGCIHGYTVTVIFFTDRVVCAVCSARMYVGVGVVWDPETTEPEPRGELTFLVKINRSLDDPGSGAYIALADGLLPFKPISNKFNHMML
jgi:hypothetical protein